MDKKNISWKSVELRLWWRFLTSFLLLLAPVGFSAAIGAVYVGLAGTDDLTCATAFGMLVGADGMVLVGVLSIIFDRGWVLYSFARFAGERNLPELKHLLRQERLVFPHRS